MAAKQHALECRAPQRGPIALLAAVAVAMLASGCTASSADAPTGSAAATSQAAASADPGAAAAQPAAAAASMPPLLPLANNDAGSPAAKVTDLLNGELLADGSLKEDYAGLRSVIVLADGKTLYERYFDSQPTDYHHVFSVTKSVISTLIGIAIAEGKIPGVQATLAELLPDYAKDMPPEVAGTTLAQVLSHRGGFASENFTDGDVVAQTLKLPFTEPEQMWYYSNSGAHLASAILTEATGMSAFEYAKAKLFAPLGIPVSPADAPTVMGDDWAALDAPGLGWAADEQGRSWGSHGLRLRAQDLAKIGLLHLQQGKWDGKQVVPAKWVKQATRNQIGKADPNGAGYGYLWWTARDAGYTDYGAAGSGGQRIFVWPDKEAVVVTQVWIDPFLYQNPDRPIAEKINELAGRVYDQLP